MHMKSDVATVDIPNDFVQTDMPRDDPEDKVIMQLRGVVAELLIATAPEIYHPFVVMENGKTVLYVELLKALYGLLKSALLFYKKFLGDIQSQGFEVNPYDPCVANKIVNGKQLTVVWHVDDLKASHVDPKVIDGFIKWLKDKYEDKEIGLLKATHGKIHNYLGMNLDYTEEGIVKIDMIDYVKAMVKDFPVDLSRYKKVSSPAAQHIFKVREDGIKLDENKAKIFHNMVARGLFLTKRARGDIHPTISFLMTRVSKPDEDDWKKLIRLMKYLDQTFDMVPRLSADGSSILKWHVDGAHAVHPDGKGHTGGMLTLGEGGAYNTSVKQKLNTCSSTETELVGADDLMPQIIWTNYFLEGQGYKSRDTIVYQDNKSTMLLEKNGKISLSKRTKHINNRYFFVKDRQDRGEVKIVYCPTDEMIADFFTKPLQGYKFLKFHKLIMNLKEDVKKGVQKWFVSRKKKIAKVKTAQ